MARLRLGTLTSLVVPDRTGSITVTIERGIDRDDDPDDCQLLALMGVATLRVQRHENIELELTRPGVDQVNASNTKPPISVSSQAHYIQATSHQYRIPVLLCRSGSSGAKRALSKTYIRHRPRSIRQHIQHIPYIHPGRITRCDPSLTEPLISRKL